MRSEKSKVGFYLKTDIEHMPPTFVQMFTHGGNLKPVVSWKTVAV